VHISLIMPIPFLHPASIMITGPSGSGKTVFIRRLITENMIYPNPERIVIVYGEWQKEYEKLAQFDSNIEFIKGPMSLDLYNSFSPEKRNLLILDDQLIEAAKSDQVEKYFVQGSHHRNLTIALITQNIFEKGKAMRTSNLNTQYLVVYKNPRDKGQASFLGRQMFPSKWKNFLGALEDATKEPYSYLIVDLKPDTPEEFRLRSNIFPVCEKDEAIGTNVYIIP